MQIPNTTHSGNEPFLFKNGTLVMPQTNPNVPVEHQRPKVKVFCVSDEDMAQELTELMEQCFRKKCIIWHMEHNWDKTGTCNVLVFYSEIVKPDKPVDPVNAESKTVGSISPKVVDIQSKEDKLFDTFMETLDFLKEEDDSNYDIHIQDDDY